MANKLFGLIDTRPKVLFHYVVLTLALFGCFYLGERLVNLSLLNNIQMFMFWFVALVISDSLIHNFLKID